MQGMITRVTVTWTYITGGEQRQRDYTVVPDEAKIIRDERMEDLLDDLTLICEQLDTDQGARATAPTGRALRRIK